jgi:hypothetical protein
MLHALPERRLLIGIPISARAIPRVSLPRAQVRPNVTAADFVERPAQSQKTNTDGRNHLSQRTEPRETTNVAPPLAVSAVQRRPTILAGGWSG